MTLLMASAFDIGVGNEQPPPYLKLGGSTATYTGGLRGTFKVIQLVGFTHYEVPINVITTPGGTDKLYWSQDFVVAGAGADNSQWCLWRTGKPEGTTVDYAVGLKYTGSTAKLQVWEVTNGSPPTFNAIGSPGGTTIATGTVFRICLQMDLDSANYPIVVRLDTGSGFGTEISTSSSAVRKPTTQSTHYQFEVVAGDKVGDITVQYDNEIWTDDAASSQVSGEQNRLTTVMAHPAITGLTSPGEWVSGDPGNKKYWLTADFRRTGTPPAAIDDHMIGDTNDEDGFSIQNHNGATTIVGVVVAMICDFAPFMHTKLCTTESGDDYGTSFVTATNTSNNNIIDAYPSTPKGDDWDKDIFNTLQVQVKAKEDNLKIEVLGVIAVGTGLAQPAAVPDNASDVASICPVAPPATRRIFITT